MAKFLFVYGYESPAEWEVNRRSGTDDESSSAVWINAQRRPMRLPPAASLPRGTLLHYSNLIQSSRSLAGSWLITHIGLSIILLSGSLEQHWTLFPRSAQPDSS